MSTVKKNKQQTASGFRPRTPAEVRAGFDREGLSISKWAMDNNIRPGTVYQLLSDSRIKAKRGDAHRAAVLLGMKEGVVA